MSRRFSALLLLLFPVLIVQAQDPKPADVKPAPNKIVAVTVYQNTALVTREVTAPDAAGITEVIVTGLPNSTINTSLYAEGSDGIRILSARYRTRAISEDNREEVRKLEAKIKDSHKKLQLLTADSAALSQNTAFVTKLENFTAATLQTLTEKGHLDSEKTIALATFIRDTRTKGIRDEVALKQQMDGIQEEMAFTQRVLQEKSGGVSRTERDAVIVIEKTNPGAGTIRLNYLVSQASWRPQYKLRAGTKEKNPVTIEYLASVTQQTGEDWNGVNLVLSTAQPLLNAAPPDLRTLEIAIGGVPGGPGGPGGPGLVASQPMNGPLGGPGGGGGAGFGGGFGGGGGMPAPTAYLKGLEEQSRGFRAQSNAEFNKKNGDVGNTLSNQAAALDQYVDLLASKEEIAKRDTVSDILDGGPSVTYHLKTKLSLPSRNDDQVLEIAKLDVAPRFYYKAVPVLTTNVYRLADLVNTTDYVLLPGEATMYLGMDFVGQTKMPLVAIGKPFTVGFGVDPQLQVQRKLMDKTRNTQGGNQVLTFKYRILLNSYKANAVDVQVWDRMPHAEAMQTIAITVQKGESELSKDPLYLRDDRTKNLLRWDVKIDPKQNGEKAMAVDYEYKMEFERSVNIGAFLAK